MKKLAVIGWPVKHSKSPIMHNAALKQAGLDQEWIYEKVAVEPDQVIAFLDRVRSGEFQGCNVTIPHKVAVHDAMDSLDVTAELIGAVNTVVRQPDGSLKGYNTDAHGAFSALAGAGLTDLKGKHVVIIGAGGAARASIAGACLAGASKITIINRTLEKGEAIRDEFCQKKPEWSSIEWKVTNSPSADELADAAAFLQMTSLGMKEEDPMPLDSNSLPVHGYFLEAIYAPSRTKLLIECEKKGLKIVDGLEMLVGQGAISLGIWTGIQPDIKTMINSLRNS